MNDVCLMFVCGCLINNRNGEYAKVVGSLLQALKQARLAAVFFKLAANATPPPQNVATVLLALAEYCLAAQQHDECGRACARVIDIGNGQQREAAKLILARLQQQRQRI